MRRLFKIRFFLALIFFGILLVSCGSYVDSREERASRAEKSKGDLLIGAVQPYLDFEANFVKGVDLAVEEINRKGGVLGRKLKIIVREDKRTQAKARKVAREFAGNPDVVAVIGHSHGESALTASITYEFNGIVFISTIDTSMALTNHNFHYVIRTTPPDPMISKRIAKWFQTKNYKKIVTLFDRTDYGREFAHLVHSDSDEAGIKTVFQRSFNLGEDEFYRIFAEFQDMEFDAIFLAAHMPEMAILIKQAREAGIKTPFIARTDLESPLLWEIAGEGSVGSYITTTFNSRSQDEDTLRFIKDFEKTNKTTPDVWATKGYDAVKLLAFAMEKAGSAVPKTVATALHNTKTWKGVTGDHSFSQNGELIRKKIYIKTIKNGIFEMVNE